MNNKITATLEAEEAVVAVELLVAEKQVIRTARIRSRQVEEFLQKTMILIIMNPRFLVTTISIINTNHHFPQLIVNSPLLQIIFKILWERITGRNIKFQLLLQIRLAITTISSQQQVMKNFINKIQAVLSIDLLSWELQITITT